TEQPGVTAAGHQTVASSHCIWEATTLVCCPATLAARTGGSLPPSMAPRRSQRSRHWVLNIHTQIDSERRGKLPDLRTGYLTVRLCGKKTGVVFLTSPVDEMKKK